MQVADYHKAITTQNSTYRSCSRGKYSISSSLLTDTLPVPSIHNFTSALAVLLFAIRRKHKTSTPTCSIATLCFFPANLSTTCNKNNKLPTPIMKVLSRVFYKLVETCHTIVTLDTVQLSFKVTVFHK